MPHSVKHFFLIFIGLVLLNYNLVFLANVFSIHFYKTTQDISVYSYIIFFSFFPEIIFSILGGVLVDRVNKLRLTLKFAIEFYFITEKMMVCLGSTL